jgi:hypothetical protein
MVTQVGLSGVWASYWRAEFVYLHLSLMQNLSWRLGYQVQGDLSFQTATEMARSMPTCACGFKRRRTIWGPPAETLGMFPLPVVPGLSSPRVWDALSCYYHRVAMAFSLANPRRCD